MPRRTLLLLAVFVLLAHALLLMQWPARTAVAPRPGMAVFDTRMLAPDRPDAPQQTAKPPAAKKKPATRPKRRHKAAHQIARKPAADSMPAPQAHAAADAPPVPDAAVPLPGIDPGIALLPEVAQAVADPLPPADAQPPQVGAGSAKQEGVPQAAVQGLSALPAAQPSGTSAAMPVLLPPSSTLEFDVAGKAKGFQYSASAELQWRQEGERYEARQKISAFLLGSRTQTSVGRITAQGLEPERFVDQARRERSAQFDFAAHEVRFSGNAQPAALAAGAQDRLSMFIQLAALLAAAPEQYPPGTQIALTTVNARHADDWVFAVEGLEELDLPAGKTPALKLQRLPRPGRTNEQKAELWLGTQQDYLPVRIRLSEDNGDYADLLLQERTTP